MMKKRVFLSILLLLLSLCMLLSSCEKVDLGDDDEATTESDDSTVVGTVFGTWYSTGNQTVVVIPENLSTVTLYQLKVGYYEYSKIITGSCTYEDHVLTMTGNDGKTYSWVFDAKTGTLSASMGSDTSSYTRRDNLPTEHVEIPFPDFAKLKCEDVVTLGKYTELTYSEDCYAEAAISIFKNYYDSAEKTPGTIADRAAKQGDFVNIDYTGYLDGVKFDGGEAKSQDISLISNSGYIPGFAEGVIGKTAGSTFDVEVTFPEDYHSKEMAGKAVVFKMTLNKIYDLSISDADIATFTKNEYATYQALLDDTAKSLIKNDLWNQVIKGSECADMPESFYGYFYAYYRDMYHYYAALYQMDYNTLLSYYGITENDFLETAKKEALQFAVAFALSAKNNITYTQAEYDAKLEYYVAQLVDGGSYTREEALASINESKLEFIAADLTVSTVTDWIYAQNVK